MDQIIPRDRSLVIACDVPFEDYVRIVEATGDLEVVGGYKVGVAFLDVGFKKVVDAARKITDKPIIYDHQKAGTDIHESTPQAFMDAMIRAGVDAVILFPEAGPITQYEWTIEAQNRDLGVLVGGEMTHPRYLEGDFSNGKKDKDYSKIFKELGMERDLTGYIRKFAPEDMYELAARMEVNNFVVPGNKPDRILYYRGLIEDGCKVVDAVYWSPGLVDQGGEIAEGGRAAGKRFNAIVGRGVTGDKNYRKAAILHGSQL